ncbi:hypothetical protein CKO15_04915 [Halorhodospira abdelmalekii]|uniref:TonB-dependent receptor plug domain-containing protein n=1 Tax=Halorhodospira abdelmalekii TaxID=421629 RepID=UPI001F5B972F|nr:TonB-dependent receptor [Halorhodospira abdelmalekii]MBK1734637.1 hypothetical protein [Halorhodospira abdelmalekii]
MAQHWLKTIWIILVPSIGFAANETHSPPTRLEPVVITSSPSSAADRESVQSVSVISRSDIESVPAATLADLLSTVAGVDVRRRGGAGVQADIGIRGTAYEQTLVLLNGIPLRDPQTGHHDLNLPLPLEQIERIEIVRGPGGIQHGGHATGGLINVITREPDGGEHGFTIRGGSFATRGLHAHTGYGDGRSGHLLSGSIEVSDGHLSGSRADSDLRQMSYTGYAHLDAGSLSWGVGAEERAFGAWKFYTADFPEQREKTASRLAYLSGRSEIGEWSIAPRIFWRGHEDWFSTQVGDDEHINEHETDVRGVQLASERSIGSDETAHVALGVGVIGERIESSALDDHRRQESTAWIAHRQALWSGRGVFEAGLNGVRFSDYGNEWLPSFGFGYRFSERWRASFSSARSVRVASWTEQHLSTSGNVGNPELAPERSDLHEVALHFTTGDHRLTGALFERRTDDLIDWGRDPGSVEWKADNFDGHRTRGGEIEWRWQPADGAVIRSLGVAWTGIETRLDEEGMEIKYALDYPRQTLVLNGLFDLAAAGELSVQARGVDRTSSGRAALISARLQRQFAAVALFVEGTNLLDEEVIEAGFAPQPGRALFVGLSWRAR